MLSARKGEDGFTLVELIAAMAVASAVLVGLTTLLGGGLRANARIEDRSDASQRGRAAVEEIVRKLRSNLCMDRSPTDVAPIESGDDNAVTFYGQTLTAPAAGQWQTGAFAPERIRFSFDAATGRLLEERWRPAAGQSYPQITTWVQQGTRVIADHIRRVPGRPVFAYYAYAGDGTVDPAAHAPLPVPADINRIAMVRIAFVAGPGHDRVSDAAATSTFDESVDLRLVDPEAPQTGTVCRL